MKKETKYIIWGIAAILVIGMILILWFPSPEKDCASRGGRYIDGACRTNNVCPMPFYDVGPVDPTDDFNYNFECGVPDSIKKRIGSTYKSGGKQTIMSVNADDDDFKNKASVKAFWMKQGFTYPEIHPGGGEGSTNGCPGSGCSGGAAWFYQQQDKDMCTYFLSDTKNVGARLSPAGQGTYFDIDGKSFGALGRCDSTKCTDKSCRIPRTKIRDNGSTFFINSYQ